MESNNIREFALSENLYSHDKSCVIWNGSACGVNQSKFDISKKAIWRENIRGQFGFDKDDVVFAFAARLTEDKGVNELLGAFLELEKTHSNVKLVVMGGDDNTNSLDRNIFVKAKVSKNILFTGNVGNVEEYYAASDVFVSPSYREGFGLVAIEAQTMGLPAIVSDVPGQTDTIINGKTGLLCKVKDTTDVMETKYRLLDCHKSQFYEWLPWVDLNEKNFDASGWSWEQRMEHLKKHWGGRFAAQAARVNREGVETAEIFELSPYGRKVSPEEFQALLQP